MGQPKDFKYYLRRKSDGKYYYVSAGSVLTQVGAIELPNAPDGWQDNTVTWERGFKYHGLFTNYSTPLKFIRDGATIARYLYLSLIHI